MLFFVCHTKVKEPSVPNYSPGGRIFRFIPFLRALVLYGKWELIRPGFELESPSPFLTTVTTAPQAHVYVYVKSSWFQRREMPGKSVFLIFEWVGRALLMTLNWAVDNFDNEADDYETVWVTPSRSFVDSCWSLEYWPLR